MTLRNLVPKNLHNVARGGGGVRHLQQWYPPSPSVVPNYGFPHLPWVNFLNHYMALKLSWTKCVNMVCAVTPLQAPVVQWMFYGCSMDVLVLCSLDVLIYVLHRSVKPGLTAIFFCMAILSKLGLRCFNAERP